MGYRLVCDKCGAQINPASSRIVVGYNLGDYNLDDWNPPEEKYDLCVSCAMRFKQWMNSPFPIVIGKEGDYKNV